MTASENQSFLADSFLVSRWCNDTGVTAQKMKFPVEDFFNNCSNCEQIRKIH